LSGFVFLYSELAKSININPTLIRPEVLQWENLDLDVSLLFHSTLVPPSSFTPKPSFTLPCLSLIASKLIQVFEREPCVGVSIPLLEDLRIEKGLD